MSLRFPARFLRIWLEQHSLEQKQKKRIFEYKKNLQHWN